MSAATPVVMDVEQRAALPYPRSLPEFQRLFPDDPACAAYLEKARWESGFVCPRYDANGEPFRIASRPGVLTCRKCRSQSARHLQAYLNEFTFRFSRRFYPFNAFRSLLGIASSARAPTYDELYSVDWAHPTSSGCMS